MSYQNGHIIMKRSIMAKGWYSKPNEFIVMIHLLMEANYADTDSLKRGQILVNYTDLARDCGLTYDIVRMVFRRLGGYGEVRTRKVGRMLLVTLCNYDTYQNITQIDTTNLPQSDHDVTTYSPQSDQNKTKEKNTGKKEEKKDTIVSKENSDGLTPQEVFTMWNSICTRCSQIRALSDSRAAKVRSRIRQMGDNPRVTMRELFEKINASDFLCNGSPNSKNPNWRVSFDWVFDNDSNWLRIMEGKYDRKGQQGLLPFDTDWLVVDKSYSMSDFENGHLDEYERLTMDLKARLKAGHKLVWKKYWIREDYV